MNSIAVPFLPPAVAACHLTCLPTRAAVDAQVAAPPLRARAATFHFRSEVAPILLTPAHVPATMLTALRGQLRPASRLFAPAPGPSPRQPHRGESHILLSH